MFSTNSLVSSQLYIVPTNKRAENDHIGDEWARITQVLYMIGRLWHTGVSSSLKNYIRSPF